METVKSPLYCYECGDEPEDQSTRVCAKCGSHRLAPREDFSERCGIWFTARGHHRQCVLHKRHSGECVFPPKDHIKEWPLTNCIHGTQPTEHCYECEVANIPQPLPEKCCAKCLWWDANQTGGYQRFCWRHKEFTDDRYSCGCFTGQTDLTVNVPNHCPNGTMNQPNPNPVEGPVEIVIATFGTPTPRVSGKMVSDLDWLRYCLRSIRKHCAGFQGVTIAHPAHEQHLFSPLIQDFGVRLQAFEEPPDSGFLMHEIEMAEADTYVPASTKYVLHCDADCIFRMPTTPEHYFWDDKPYYLHRPWDSLTTEDPHRPGSKVISDCLQWRVPTDAQLGTVTPYYAMCMNTAVFPIDFYRKYREHIEIAHRMPFRQFMLSGNGKHPANRMDWTAMGAFAYLHMRDRFRWFDVSDGTPYPEDRKLSFWSHGGIRPEDVEVIERLIS